MVAASNPAFMYAGGSRYVQDGEANDIYLKMTRRSHHGLKPRYNVELVFEEIASDAKIGRATRLRSRL